MKAFEFIDYVANHCTVYDEETFHEAFVRDLTLALYSVLIQSPYLSYFGITRLLEVFKVLIARGVRVCIFLQEPKEWDRAKMEKLRADIAPLLKAGVHVTLSPKKHEKVAVIDGKTLYDGSLNIMSYNKDLHTERMTRKTSPHMAQLAIGKLSLENCPTCIDLRIANVIGPCMYMVELETLAASIKLKRTALGISQAELAEMVGASKHNISRIESGKSVPELVTLIAICKALGDSLTILPTETLPHVDHLTMNLPVIRRCA